jgi:hypothetical protein
LFGYEVCLCIPQQFFHSCWNQVLLVEPEQVPVPQQQEQSESYAFLQAVIDSWQYEELRCTIFFRTLNASRSAVACNPEMYYNHP